MTLRQQQDLAGGLEGAGQQAILRINVMVRG